MKKLLLFYLVILLSATIFVGVDFSYAKTLSETLSGKILLQVEDNGEAWYVYPKDLNRYYLGRPSDAFDIMRYLGLGVSEANFNSWNNYAPSRLAGYILLRPEANGEAYYVYPEDLRMYYLGRPADAFELMRVWGLGISNVNLEQIAIATNSKEVFPVPNKVTNTVPANFTHYEDCYNQACLTTNFDYLIVSRTMFEYTLQDFVQYKKEQGFKVGLVSGDWIYNNYSGLHFADKIKNVIKAIHENNGLQYVLLVGDSEMPDNNVWEYESIGSAKDSFDQYYNLSITRPWDIPTGYFVSADWYVDPVTYEELYVDKYSSTLTDLFYVSLENWDTSGNGVYEEFGDLIFNNEDRTADNSWLGEMYLGRWPVRNDLELQTIITKTKNAPEIKQFNFLDGITDNENIINNFSAFTPYRTVLENSFYGLPVNFYNNVDGLSYSKKQEREDAFGVLSNVNYVQYTSADHQAINENIINNSGYLAENAHGALPCIAPYGSENMICINNTTFNYIFPVLDLSSCSVMAFYSGEQDVFSEHYLTQEKGPVAVVGTFGYVDDIYYNNLFIGKSIGESFFNSLKLGESTPSTANMILGDPSLKFNN